MNELLKIAYDAMDEKLAQDIVVIDFSKQSPFVDYFIIADAKNYRMAKSIIENPRPKPILTNSVINSWLTTSILGINLTLFWSAT